jgi:hypothetical protein
MATDYRFGIKCWQDQAGDEDAKLNVYLNGTKVVSEAAVTGTDPDTDFNIVSWESAGLGDVGTNTIVTIKVELVNNLYVDADTDRNVYISGIGYIDKDPDGTYKSWREAGDGETPDFTAPNSSGESKNMIIDTVTDFTATNHDKFTGWWIIPNTVTSSSIADGWWDTVIATDSFHTIVIWGDETDGVTITYEIGGTAQYIDG